MMNPNIHKNIYNVLTEAYKENNKNTKSKRKINLKHTPLRNFFIGSGVIWAVFMIFLFLISKGAENIFYSIIFGVITPSTLLVISGLIIGLFYIKFDDDEITYRNYLGVKKVFKYTEITSALRTNNNVLEIYSKNKKILAINLRTFAQRGVIKFLANKNINIKEKSTINNFIIKPTKESKVGMAILALFFIGMGIIIGFTFLRTYPNATTQEQLTNNVTAYFMMAILSLIGITLYIFNAKSIYIITNKEIISKSFLRKDKILKFNEIIGYQKYRKDMAIVPTYFIYDENGTVIKINDHFNFTNIHLLKKLIKEQNWPKLKK